MSNVPRAEQITKLDAIQRQLRTAIQLFFEERDSLPIYTLAAAAQGLLRDLLRPRGEGSFIKDSDFIVPEKRAEFMRLINRPQNFLKHADRDPEEVLERIPEASEGVLMDCLFMYQRLTGRQLREGIPFTVWYSVAYPQVLKPGPFADSIAVAKSASGGSVPGKADYLRLLARGDLWREAD